MKIVIGQGSCGIATGAKKVANRFEEILGEKNIDINVDITGCIGTCFLEPPKNICYYNKKYNKIGRFKECILKTAAKISLLEYKVLENIYILKYKIN